MLLQSHEGNVHLLPALPVEWKNGSVAGLRARDGFEVSMAWKDLQLTQTAIKSAIGGICKVRSAQKVRNVLSGKKTVAFTTEDNNVIVFETQPGKVYILLY